MIFGIDFGTTFTVVSWVKNGRLEFLDWSKPGQNGGVYEAIARDARPEQNSGVYEAEYGQNGEFLKPTQLNGIKNIKRLIAQNSYNLENDNALIYKTTRDFFLKVHNQILGHLGGVQEDSVDEKDSKFETDFLDCVLTVPARFDDVARNAIRSAAISAGFRVIKLLTEPVAASIAVLSDFENLNIKNTARMAESTQPSQGMPGPSSMEESTQPSQGTPDTAKKEGFNKSFLNVSEGSKMATFPQNNLEKSINIQKIGKKNGYYLVYDLGGGTFDLSLLKFENGIFQVIAIDGLANFGMTDVDEIIAQNLQISLENAENFRSEIFDRDDGDSVKSAILAAFERTYKIVEKMLAEQNFSAEEIVGLILAGGGSRSAPIKGHFSGIFNVIESESPDLLVSAGAAIYGNFTSCHFLEKNDKFDQNSITKDTKTGQNSGDYEAIENKTILIDAIPFDLGLETLGDKIEVLIPKNSPLPYFCTEYFSPKSKVVKLNILQGISKKASECTSLAHLEIEANEKFSVTFMLDLDGILSIKVGEQVVVVSSKNYFSKPNAQIQEWYEKLAKIAEKTKEQEKIFDYLAQALNIELSDSAFDWLKNRVEKIL